VSATELRDHYEQLRRRATEGVPGRRDGLAVLRQQGIHAWIALAAAEPPSSPRVEAAAAIDPLALGIDPSPLVFLCTDMLLSTLTTPLLQEIR